MNVEVKTKISALQEWELLCVPWHNERELDATYSGRYGLFVTKRYGSLLAFGGFDILENCDCDLTWSGQQG